MLKTQFIIATALLCGVAIGYFARPSGKDAPADEREYVAKTAVPDKGEAASVKALRRRIAELERLLAEKGANAEGAISNAVAEAMGNAAPQPGGRPHASPREWMENLKKNDPARYAQMTNRFARWRQRRLDRARSRIDFLASVDTSHMSAGAKKTHDELQDLIARREELEEQMHQEDLTDDQRHRIFEQMRETDRAMRRLNGEERKNLIEETARNLGFDGEAAQEISATLQDVIDATGGNGHGEMMPPPDGAQPPVGGPGGPGGR